ncbi:AraC family transcriptional regulator [Pseudooceanicola marinus]|uniref:AraC family transcriptional regulator n=1 Tax=Pseudooceanicola marinus TaxID=396013 RepID=UPI001CD605BB|nr:AraC family transcriptional regulator [Pseudooceanicola marinus]MCA1336367.1 AraC family transcriptional regulator [Pseudooceanicola marinus]
MVSAFYARKQIDHAVHVPDRSRLYEIVGLSPDDLQDPATMLPAERYYALLDAIADSEWPDLTFHMRVCASMRCEELGAFGLAFKSAPTLRQAFTRMGRYTRLHNQVSLFATVDRPEEGVFCWTHEKPRKEGLGGILSNEAALGTTLTLCRETADADISPVRVQFAHERRGSIDALTAHFGVEPVFGAEIDGMQFALEDIDRPTLKGDPAIWAFFTDHLDSVLPDAAAEAGAEVPLEVRVVEEIAKLLSGGVPQLSEVAQSLGMGARTLQRRLSQRGCTYQSLVDEARRQLAHQLVSGTRYSLSEIAFLTGFSEQSAFTRAFKRWSGQTPGAYRSAAVA